MAEAEAFLVQGIQFAQRRSVGNRQPPPASVSRAAGVPGPSRGVPARDSHALSSGARR